jgi:UDP-GlcNAc:undecaprenyl-phosphate GlcNAc-1-phosphate transferase
MGLFESDYLSLVIFIPLAFISSKLIIPIIISISFKKLLFDDPDDIRKIHKGQIPTFGGVAIYASFLVIFALSPFSNRLEGFSLLVAATIILFVIGLKDDLVGLDPLKKLASQIFAALLIVFGMGVSFTFLGNLFGISEVSYLIGSLLSLITIIALINAYNLIDGIDGLAAAIGLIATIFYGTWFLVAGHIELGALSLILAAAIAGFLWYNLSPASIFMGDTGSMVVGCLIAYLTISFIKLGIESPSVATWQSASPVIAVSILIIPIYDTFRVILIRILTGKSFMDSDKIHVHHNLIDEGLNHNQATFFLSILTVFIVSVIIGLSYFLSNTVLLVVLILISGVLLPTNHWKRGIFQFLKRKKILHRKKSDFNKQKSEISGNGKSVPKDFDNEMIKPRKVSNKATMNH